LGRNRFTDGKMPCLAPVTFVAVVIAGFDAPLIGMVVAIQLAGAPRGRGDPAAVAGDGAIINFAEELEGVAIGVAVIYPAEGRGVAVGANVAILWARETGGIGWTIGRGEELPGERDTGGATVLEMIDSKLMGTWGELPVDGFVKEDVGPPSIKNLAAVYPKTKAIVGGDREAVGTSLEVYSALEARAKVIAGEVVARAASIPLVMKETAAFVLLDDGVPPEVLVGPILGIPLVGVSGLMRDVKTRAAPPGRDFGRPEGIGELDFDFMGTWGDVKALVMLAAALPVIYDEVAIEVDAAPVVGAKAEGILAAGEGDAADEASAPVIGRAAGAGSIVAPVAEDEGAVIGSRAADGA